VRARLDFCSAPIDGKFGGTQNQMMADFSIYLWLGVILGLGATILRVYSHGF
jgi:hypothetical protein